MRVRISTRHAKESRNTVGTGSRQSTKALGLYGEDLSRLVRRSPEGEGGRDAVEEAQYEVLGNEAKRHVRS
jgi:hypothetical protein